MPACCQRDGYIQALKFLWIMMEGFGFHRLADRIDDEKRRALVLRHPWMKMRMY